MWGLALNAVPLELGEIVLMSGHRYDRILASTALALILAASIGASAAAQDGGMAGRDAGGSARRATGRAKRFRASSGARAELRPRRMR